MRGLIKFWSGRAALIALPSLILAVLFGFSSRPCLAGMALGIGLWIAMYVVCAALIQGGTLRLRPNIIRILRNILIVRTYIAGIFFFEMLTGIWASFLVDALSRLPILAAVAPKSPGFLSAFLMTLTQGALITLSLVLMAGLVLGIRAMVAGKPEAGRGS